MVALDGPVAGDLAWTYLNPTGNSQFATSVAWSGDQNVKNGRPWADVRGFGAVGDGVTNDSAAFTSAISAVASGGMLFIPPGRYLLSSQVTIAPTGPLAVFAYGATIITSGAISGLRISAAVRSTARSITIQGLTIDHSSNAAATFGLELIAARKIRLIDCNVIANSVSGSYAAVRLANSDPADNSTGTFGTRIVGLTIGKASGTDIPVGIVLQGSANATTIEECSISDCTVAVKLTTQGSNDAIPNAVRIAANDFESCNTVCLIDGMPSSNIMGPRITDNRVEIRGQTSSFLKIVGNPGPPPTGIQVQPSVPPFLEGNLFTFGIANYLINPNKLYVSALDIANTPSLGSSAGKIQLPNGFQIEAVGAQNTPLRVRPGGGNRGIGVLTADASTEAVSIVWSGTANKGRVYGATTGSLALGNIQGISRTLTDAKNLRGQATFAKAGSVTVVFGTAEPDASYFIALGGSAGETFWVTAKTLNGFTLRSSNAASTAVVDWILVR